MQYHDADTEARRLRAVPAFSRCHEARAIPEPGAPVSPRDGFLLQTRAYVEAEKRWAEWEAIDLAQARERWPSPPPVEVPKPKPLSTAQRLDRIESILRSSGSLRDEP